MPDRTNPAPVRLGVIGLGDFGQEHLRAAMTVPELAVVSVADVMGLRAAETAAALDIPAWYSNPQHLLEAGDIDGVIVATPAGSHLELTRRAVELGIAVLLEKPIIDRLEHSLEMQHCAQQGIVVPAHILRFMDPYRALHEELISEGAPGVGGLSAHRHRSHDHILRFPEHDPILMTMIHDIDQAIWLMGSRAVTVSAKSSSVRGGPRPDLVVATVRDDQDRVWELAASWLLNEERIADWLEVYTDGGIRVASPDERMSSRAGLKAEISHFSDCVKQSRPSEVISMDDAIHGIEIAFAINESAASGGKEVSLNGN